jgi:hypothetical protein
LFASQQDRLIVSWSTDEKDVIEALDLPPDLRAVFQARYRDGKWRGLVLPPADTKR